MLNFAACTALWERGNGLQNICHRVYSVVLMDTASNRTIFCGALGSIYERYVTPV